ncbi:MAG: hypothetical protein MUE70_16525 [Desulfobacterales bacterium]|jgi:hypothetical protein|nr:hypothetical protein [Desulfobacterales bacterium]
MSGYATGIKAGVKVSVEVFICAQEQSAAVRYYRQLRDVAQSNHDPDDVVTEIIADTGIDRSNTVKFSHSTSWRFEPEKGLVLTYIVWVSGILDTSLPTRVVYPQHIRLPQGAGPFNPRPFELREVDVLVHGLGHLKYLLDERRNPDVADALGCPEAAAFFGMLRQELAGRYMEHNQNCL